MNINAFVILLYNIYYIKVYFLKKIKKLCCFISLNWCQKLTIKLKLFSSFEFEIEYLEILEFVL